MGVRPGPGGWHGDGPGPEVEGQQRGDAGDHGVGLPGAVVQRDPRRLDRERGGVAVGPACLGQRQVDLVGGVGVVRVDHPGRQQQEPHCRRRDRRRGVRPSVGRAQERGVGVAVEEAITGRVLPVGRGLRPGDRGHDHRQRLVGSVVQDGARQVNGLGQVRQNGQPAGLRGPHRGRRVPCVHAVERCELLAQACLSQTVLQDVGQGEARYDALAGRSLRGVCHPVTLSLGHAPRPRAAARLWQQGQLPGAGHPGALSSATYAPASQQRPVLIQQRHQLEVDVDVGTRRHPRVLTGHQTRHNCGRDLVDQAGTEQHPERARPALAGHLAPALGGHPVAEGGEVDLVLAEHPHVLGAEDPLGLAQVRGTGGDDHHDPPRVGVAQPFGHLALTADQDQGDVRGAVSLVAGRARTDQDRVGQAPQCAEDGVVGLVVQPTAQPVGPGGRTVERGDHAGPDPRSVTGVGRPGVQVGQVVGRDRSGCVGAEDEPHP
ncbi:hypothetical protein NOCARDAX2BIS_30067 [Nocardioides sp. AX2bis]|nr:hypothetical protein NOCARDAX2BIS_30067 [Nocardioides sp. AX2bis]